MFLPQIYFFKFHITNFILLLWTSTLVVASEDKTLNLEVDFDLTPEENGAPTLRTREFNESAENKARSFSNEGGEMKVPAPAIRADSLSDSDETSVTRDNPGNISKDKVTDQGDSDEDDDYDDDENSRIKSTKGLNPDEYEPEENPKIHGSYKGYSVSDSESNRKRRRRDIGKYKEIKRRGAKVRSARKQGVSWF